MRLPCMFYTIVLQTIVNFRYALYWSFLLMIALVFYTFYSIRINSSPRTFEPISPDNLQRGVQ